jgi:hypothetical protein
MRPGYIDLDFQHEEFLTAHDEDQIASFNKLSEKDRAGQSDALLHRDGDPDPKKLSHGGHPNGEPIRIARDRISGLMFAKIADHLPADMESPHLVKRHKRITEAKPFHVPGHGYWVPLKELHPKHPHAQSQPIRAAHS